MNSLNGLRSTMSTSTEICSRIEEKFIMPARLKPSLLEALERNLKPNYPHPGTRFTLIESIYFDSDALSLFREHFTSPLKRFKLRTRRYGPNGLWSLNDALIELKAKEGRVTRKLRTRVSGNRF